LERHLTPRLFDRGEHAFVPCGQHALAQVVNPLEVLPPRDHQLARREEHLKGALLGLPLPPAAGLPVAAREVGRAHRAALAYEGEQAFDLFAVRLDPAARVVPALRLCVEHSVAVERVVLDGEEACLVRPVLEELALGEQLVEPARLVVAEAAPEYEVRATGYDVDGV